MELAATERNGVSEVKFCGSGGRVRGRDTG